MAIDKGLRSVSVFLDLRKAFDVIRHDVLLTKLQSYGDKESELRWFYGYLSERSQCVVFKDAIASLFWRPAGVGFRTYVI